MSVKTEQRRADGQLRAFDYLVRGFRRNGGAALALVGQVARDGDGRTAQFSLEVERDVLKAVAFTVSTCATLIAYCEFVAERITGAKLSEALVLTPEAIIAPLSGIPPHKYDCAHLAVKALHAAVETAQNGGK